MRVCLVKFPSPFLIDDNVFPPLGLLSIGTVLKNKGWEVKIYDSPLIDIPLDYSYYGFGPTIAEYGFALKLKKLIKLYNPLARIVIGGPYATINLEVCLNDGFDCIVTRDGELVVEDAFLSNEKLIDGGENNLDNYEIVDRSLIDIKSYRYLIDDRLATSIMTSQGCPFKCSFCCKNYKTVRMRSVEHIEKELNYLVEKFNYSALIFPDDLFILDRDRTEKISKMLKNRSVIWRCLVRADLIVKYGSSFSSMLFDSGCYEVGMGIESGSDQILKNINKGESIDTMRNAIKILKNSGIRVKGFFILGLPGESHKTLNETREFLEYSELDDVDIKIYQPYKGTPIWENKDQFDINWSNNIVDYEHMFYKGRKGDYQGTIYTSNLTNKEIYDAWLDIEQKYKWSRLACQEI